MHKQKILNNLNFHGQKFSNSNYLSSQGFYLPSGIGISNKDIFQICEIFKNIIKKFNI